MVALNMFATTISKTKFQNPLAGHVSIAGSRLSALYIIGFHSFALVFVVLYNDSMISQAEGLLNITSHRYRSISSLYSAQVVGLRDT